MFTDRLAPPQRPSRLRRVVAVSIAVCALAGACSDSKNGSKEATPPSTTTTIKKDGCDPYVVYAQNRWTPVGAAVRSQPTPEAAKIGGFAPNEIISVNGWFIGEVAYPTNRPPYNSDKWFRVSYKIDGQEGWVSYAGVRGTPTEFDPSGQADGGQPGLTPPECEIE